MNKNLLFCVLLSAGTFTKAQTVFSENFEPSSPTVASWGFSDLDGDLINWEVVIGSEYTVAAGFAPGEMAGSTGYNLNPQFPPGPLETNNLLISPPISLPSLSGDEVLQISYKIGPYLDQMVNMSYSLYVLPAGTPFDPATAVAQKTVAFTQMGAVTEVVDISQFAGQNVNLYFRHHDGDGQWYLLLDDILIEKKIQLAVGETDSKTLSLYPNPATDILNVNGVKSVDSYEIFDTSGRKVSEGSDNQKIPVSKLAKGKYFIQIKSGDKIYSKSFIKK